MISILITGGAGFIGSNFISCMQKKYRNCKIINLDKLTYAGNLNNLSGVISDNYYFIQGDIADTKLVNNILETHNPSIIVNFAAESHVDKSIANPEDFIQTNIVGTANLLYVAKNHWDKVGYKNKLFFQISTDEVYGSLPEDQPNLKFREETPLSPHSPYAASKASADMLVQTYHDTYGFPTLISRCSNNFGPNQYPEKLIPVIILNAIKNKPIPIYGDGKNIRDWIFVEDHCNAILQLIDSGMRGTVFNIGGNCEIKNIDIVRFILDALDKPHSLIQHVEDRLGHDRRYAVDTTKIESLFKFHPSPFEQNMLATIDWYRKTYA